MQSPAHAGGAAGASFLVLIEGNTNQQHHDPPPAIPDAAGPSTAAGNTASGASSSTPTHVPEFDWVQIRETWGALHLYRHAPLDPYGSTRRGRLPPQPSPSPQQRPRPRHGGLFSGGPAAAAGAVEADRPGNRAAAAATELRDGGGNGHESLTPFRPARLSTVLLLDCRVPSAVSAPGSAGGGGSLPSAKVGLPLFIISSNDGWFIDGIADSHVNTHENTDTGDTGGPLPFSPAHRLPAHHPGRHAQRRGRRWRRGGGQDERAGDVGLGRGGGGLGGHDRRGPGYVELLPLPITCCHTII